MAKPKLSDETRIKVEVMFKLLEANYSKESELHKDIADKLNQYENEEITTRRVAAIHERSKSGYNTPYKKKEWQLSLSKSAFKSIIEENKSVQDKFLNIVICSKIIKI